MTPTHRRRATHAAGRRAGMAAARARDGTRRRAMTTMSPGAAARIAPPAGLPTCDAKGEAGSSRPMVFRASPASASRALKCLAYRT